jgi:hypothetical protein
MAVVYSDSARTVRGYNQLEDFSVQLVETPVAVGGTVTLETVKDSVFAKFTGGVVAANFQLNVAESASFPGFEIINRTPLTCDVSPSGAVTWKANGFVIVDVVTSIGTRRYERYMVNASMDVPRYRHNNFLAGTLGRHIYDTMAAQVAGKTFSTSSVTPYSSNNYNTTSPAVVRNPAAFTAGLDLSAITVVNGGTYGHPGLLISPRHILGADHYVASSPMTWMRPDGTFATASVVSRKRIGSSDISVAYLGAPITGIVPFKVLPKDWAKYIPGIIGKNTTQSGTRFTTTGNHPFAQLPVLFKKARAGDRIHTSVLQAIDSDAFCITASLASVPDIPTLPTIDWGSGAESGDSGGPVFAPVNGEMVLFCTFWLPQGGPFITSSIDDINAAMNSLASAAGDATAYALQHPVLTGFTSYP